MYIGAAKFNSSMSVSELLFRDKVEYDLIYLYQNFMNYEGSGVHNDSSVTECIYVAVNKTSERLIAVGVRSYTCVYSSVCVYIYICVHA